MFIPAISVMKPEIGVIFWTLLVFLIVLFLLRKMAFTPIVNALKKRELDIQKALDSAEEARQQMDQLKETNAAMLQEAREEKMKILNESKEMGKKIVKDAEISAKEKANRIMDNAHKEIEISKKTAMEDVKNQAGLLAIEISEKLMHNQLDNREKQEALVKDLVANAHLN